MQTTDQIIDEILLKSFYGKNAYEERRKRLRENDTVENVEDEVIDHPKQTYFYFKPKQTYFDFKEDSHE